MTTGSSLVFSFRSSNSVKLRRRSCPSAPIHWILRIWATDLISNPLAWRLGHCSLVHEIAYCVVCYTVRRVCVSGSLRVSCIHGGASTFCSSQQLDRQPSDRDPVSRTMFLISSARDVRYPGVLRLSRLMLSCHQVA